MGVEIDVTLLAISFPITTLVFHYISKVVTIEINQSAFESYPHMSMRLGDVSYGDGHWREWYCSEARS